MAENFETNNGADVVSGVDTVKKSRTGVVIAGAAAGVLAVGTVACATAYTLSDLVKNQVKLRFSKPENYYAWVVEKNSENFSAKLCTKYDELLNASKDGRNSSLSVKYDVSDDARAYVKDSIFGSSFAGLDEETQEVISALDSINSLKIGIDSQQNSSAVSGNFYADLNDERLITFDIAADSENFGGFFRIPEMTDKWFFAELPDDAGENAIAEFQKRYQKLFTNPEAVITTDELKSEISRYTGIWNDSVSDVKVEKKEDVTIGDMTVKYTVAVVEMDQAKCREVAEKLVSSAKEDETLKKLLTQTIRDFSEEDYLEELDEMLEEMESAESADPDAKITVKTYIDPRGDIRGISIVSDFRDVSMEDFEFSAIAGKDGNRLCAEVYAVSDGSEEFRAELTATENSKRYSGNIDITSEDETASVEFTDLAVINEEKGYISGNITVIVPDSTPVSVALNSDGSSQKISGEIAINGTNYGRLTVEMAAGQGASPVVPDRSAAISTASTAHFKLSDHVSKEEMTSFLTGLLGKLGLGGGSTEEMVDDVINSMYDDFRMPSFDDFDDDLDLDDNFDEDFDLNFDIDEDFDWNGFDSVKMDDIS